jgi:methyltransferase (TIGR00027 family)
MGYACAMGNAERPSSVLRSVSDTALLVAWHRAVETRRPDALFNDPLAVRLSAGRGEEVARKLRGGRSLAWSTIVRTVLFDEVVGRLVAEGADTVINLAAGLDARPYRLALPATLRWFEVDLPDMIRDKEEALAGDTPVCRVERVALDLSRRDARRECLARLTAGSQRTLVMTEGLLVYLPEPVVGELADDLLAVAPVADWVTDMATPAIARRVKRMWGKQLERAGTAYQFAPEEGTAFFAPHGWREEEFHPLMDHAWRLNRKMPGAWMIDVWRRLAPRRSEQIAQKWRAGVVRLRRAS